MFPLLFPALVGGLPAQAGLRRYDKLQIRLRFPLNRLRKSASANPLKSTPVCERLLVVIIQIVDD